MTYPPPGQYPAQWQQPAPGWQSPPPVQPRKKKVWPFVLVGVFVLVCAVGGGVGALVFYMKRGSAHSGPLPVWAGKQVVFTASRSDASSGGPKNFSETWGIYSEVGFKYGTAQPICDHTLTHDPLPMTGACTTAGNAYIVVLQVEEADRSPGSDHAKLSCSIAVDGKVVTSADSETAYGFSKAWCGYNLKTNEDVPAW